MYVELRGLEMGVRTRNADQMPMTKLSMLLSLCGDSISGAGD